MEQEKAAAPQEEQAPENGDVYNDEGSHVGNINAFPDIGSAIDSQLSVLHDGYLYVFKFDYRTKAEMENLSVAI